VKDAAGQYSIGNIIGKTHTVGDGQINPEKGKKVLIMDEVDGMAGNEDRGGIAELIQIIKSSKIPIICLCNDRQHQKIRSLAGHCFDLRFQKPRVEQITGGRLFIQLDLYYRTLSYDVNLLQRRISNRCACCSKYYQSLQSRH